MAIADWQDAVIAEIKAYGGTFVRKSGRSHAIYRLGTENIVLHSIGPGYDTRLKNNEIATVRQVIERQLRAGHIKRRKGPSSFPSDLVGLTSEEIDRMNASANGNGSHEQEPVEPASTTAVAVQSATPFAPAEESEGAYTCETCGFRSKHAQGLGRHQSASAGRDGHPAYEVKKKTRRAPVAAAPEPAARQPVRATPSGRVRELVQQITALLTELGELTEGQAVELRQVRDERNELRGIVDKIEQTQAVILGRRRP